MAGLGAWAAFIFYATNLERASSSVVRQLTSNLREADAVKEILGDNIRLEDKWWLGGEPYIDGAVCPLFIAHVFPDWGDRLTYCKEMLTLALG